MPLVSVGRASAPITFGFLSQICNMILLKSLSGALSLHFDKWLMVNLTADLKFDFSRTSVIILLNDLIIHKLAYLKYLYIETKELSGDGGW